MILNRHSYQVNLYRAVVDLCMTFFAWAMAFGIRFDSGLIQLTKGDDSFARYLKPAPGLILCYALVFLSTGLYKRAIEKRRVWEENFDLARAHATGFVVFVTLTYFVFDHRFSRLTLFIFFCLAPILLPLGRSLIRKINRFYLRTKKTDYKNAIILGSSDIARKLSILVEHRLDWGLKVVHTLPANQSFMVRELLEKDEITIVFIAVGADEMNHIGTIYEGLGNTVAEVILLPDFGVGNFLKAKLIHLDSLPAIALNTSPLDGYGALLKRIFDIFFSSCFLVCFSPVYMMCALAVKLTSEGPIFYKQQRMGLDGRTFDCLKFRGMRNNAEASTGPVWAKPGDDRTTSVGKWLRKTSLDEIPQFINVLRGDMSIVGPRPERPLFVQDFRQRIPGYMLRHKAKAGITGWAQVNGWRGDTSLEKRIECDLWYIQNWSLWLDIKICVLTPFKGLIHPNAY